MKKRRKGLAKLGMVPLALLVAMGLMGVSYAKWYDVVTIQGIIHTGTANVEIIEGSCVPPGEVDCQVDPPGSLTLAVRILNPVPGNYYLCNFDVDNTGTIPVKIKTVTVDRGNLPADAIVEVSPPVGTQIEPAPLASGMVSIQLAGSPGILPPGLGIMVQGAEPYEFSVTFTVVEWNQYVSPSP